MRRLTVWLLLVSALLGFWHLWMQRSKTIALESHDYNLTYTISWGWGMDQSFVIAKSSNPLSSIKSGPVEIYAKPYNSGLAVFRSTDGKTYYLGFGYRLFRFDASTGQLYTSCDHKKDVPTYSEFAKALLQATSHQDRERLDPGARRLSEYVEPDRTGDVAGEPQASRYYTGLMYLGKFGLVAERKGFFRRGNYVDFVPAKNGAEPRFSLNFHCG